MSVHSTSSALLVTIKPNQSAYFAGERFQCTLEFKNNSNAQSTHPPFFKTHSRSSSNHQSNLQTSTSTFSSSSSINSTSTFSSPNPSHSRLSSINQSPLINYQFIPNRKGLIGTHHHHLTPSTLEKKQSKHLKSHSIPTLSLAEASPSKSNHRHPLIRSASYLPGLGTQLAASIEEEDHQEDDEEEQTQTGLMPNSKSSSITDPKSLRRQSSPGTQWVTLPPTRSLSLQGHSAPAGRQVFNTDLILGWAYCQLEGQFEYDDRLIRSNVFDNIRSKPKHGGGQLGHEINSNDNSSWLGWLFGVTPASTTTQHGKGKKLPVFENPISILDIDLHLRAGESRTYTFSIDLPQELPPSFKGKSIKFSYNLVVGTSYDSRGIGARGRSQASTGTGTKVVRVPIRIYNHVFLNGTRPFYDLTCPIINIKDIALTGKVESLVPEKTEVDPDDDLESYARQLIRRSTEVEEPEDEFTGGCMTAVEIVTRSSGKVSFDINKDGKLVAELTLVKSAYRLGEIVEGTIIFNTTSDTGRVIKASISLETFESILPSHLIDPTHQNLEMIKLITRKVHSDQEEFLLYQNRSKFSLVIPTDGTPEFDCSSVKLNWSIRVKFLFLPCSSTHSIQTPKSIIGGSFQHQRIGSTSSHPTGTENSINPKMKKTGTQRGLKHTRSQSFAYGFQPTIKVPMKQTKTNEVMIPTHLLPIKTQSKSQNQTDPIIYKPIPDLSYVPIQFQPNQIKPQSEPEPEPEPEPESILIPVKIEIVECWIPVKVFPSNTEFKPMISKFFA
ncbi:Rgp1-domain-containing protein [Melampsora americana]|nr:Rgp1-domain-containing protein [Melampsora americana]